MTHRSRMVDAYTAYADHWRSLSDAERDRRCMLARLSFVLGELARDGFLGRAADLGVGREVRAAVELLREAMNAIAS